MRAKGIFLTALLLLPIATVAQKRIYEPQDSARCEQILRDSQSNKCSILDIAHLFIGEKYVAGTLEQGSEEPLTVSCTRLDCTTFIELVLALHITRGHVNRAASCTAGCSGHQHEGTLHAWRLGVLGGT